MKKMLILAVFAICACSFVVYGSQNHDTVNHVEENKTQNVFSQSVQPVQQPVEQPEQNKTKENHPLAQENDFSASNEAYEFVSGLSDDAAFYMSGVQSAWNSYVNLIFTDEFPQSAKPYIQINGKGNCSIGVTLLDGTKISYAQWDTTTDAFAYFYENQYIDEKGIFIHENGQVLAELEETHK